MQTHSRSHAHIHTHTHGEQNSEYTQTPAVCLHWVEGGTEGGGAGEGGLRKERGGNNGGDEGEGWESGRRT